MKKYWLIKSEPSSFSIDHLINSKDMTTPWEGVRNYQARNYMMNMKIGDVCLFYHSNAEPSGVIGEAFVVKECYPDYTQFDNTSKYYDKRATMDKPIWYLVDVKFYKKYSVIIPLKQLKEIKELENMPLLRKGQRLSVMPVAEIEYNTIASIAAPLKSY